MQRSISIKAKDEEIIIAAAWNIDDSQCAYDRRTEKVMFNGQWSMVNAIQEYRVVRFTLHHDDSATYRKVVKCFGDSDEEESSTESSRYWTVMLIDL